MLTHKKGPFGPAKASREAGGVAHCGLHPRGPPPHPHPQGFSEDTYGGLQGTATKTEPCSLAPSWDGVWCHRSRVHNPFTRQVLFKGSMACGSRTPKSKRSCEWSSRSGPPETAAGRMWSLQPSDRRPQACPDTARRGGILPRVTGVAQSTHKTPEVRDANEWCTLAEEKGRPCESHVPKEQRIQNF